MHKFLLVSLFLILNQCVSLRSVSITPQPKDRSNKIRAEVSKWVFLGLNFSNTYVEELPEKLIAQCPDGLVTGIITRFQIVHYPLLRKMLITSDAYCVK
ncbi:MAG: hypothetical protein AAF518_00350 [Spirochaetota bacterium]